MSVASITELLKLKVTAVSPASAALSVTIIPVGRFSVTVFVFAPAPWVIDPPAPILYPILDELPLARIVLLEVIAAVDVAPETLNDAAETAPLTVIDVAVIAPFDASEPTLTAPVVVNGRLPRSTGPDWRRLFSVANSTLPVEVLRRTVLFAPLVHDIVPFALEIRACPDGGV
jgi:hypothetical protein